MQTKVSLNHFIVKFKIKKNNYYIKKYKSVTFLMSLNLISQKVNFVVVNLLIHNFS